MYGKYSNFVRPVSPQINENLNRRYLSGEEASKMYLEEIKEAPDICKSSCKSNNTGIKKKRTVSICDSNLFVIVQNNDVDTLRLILENYPNKVDMTDEFGWSLLMIACQANSIETVKLLLYKGADTTIRDKAGNSAQSLVIKNKNYILADILLSHRDRKTNVYTDVVRLKEVFNCDVCNKTFPDKEEHLSSTIHNISASKGKKNRASYVIPQSNKGFQIMLKTGWDRDSGLGPNGSGKQYPIKTVKKIDRKGLGHGKGKIEDRKDTVKINNKKILAKDCHKSKNFEIHFRREFY